MAERMKSTVKRLLKKTKKDQSNPDAEWPMIKEKYETGLELRRPFEERWLINLAFLAGRQYTFFNKSAQILQQVIARKGRVRVVDNKILPRYRKQVSRLIRNRPVMSVVPNTNDQEDIDAAKVGTKVLKSFWRVDKMQGKQRMLAGWIYATGNAFLDDRWNPKKGPTTIKNGQLVYEGDVTCGVWSPLEILVPASGLGDVDLHEMPWMMKTKFRPMEYFEKQWGAAGKKVVPEDRKLAQADTITILGVSLSASADKVKGALEMQLYIQPCADYPKGLYIVAANGVVLSKQDYPYDFYHMEHFKDVEVPGVFWGMATTEAAIWLQKLWNRTLSDIAEFNRTMGRGKWLIPRGSNPQVTPDDSFGQMLEYTMKMGAKPEHLTIKGLPATYQQTLQVVAAGFMELYHQHEVTSGTNRSDIRSGEMVQLLLEQDDFGNVPTHAVYEEGLEAVMHRVLQRIKKGYTAERTVKIQGRGSSYEVFAFKGADLRNNTDVSVKKESSLPDSRLGRQKQILDRYQNGLYGDPTNPETRRHVMNMLDDAVIDDIYGDTYQDENIAKLENHAMMENLAQHLINLYDNHAVHIAEHNRFRKSAEYQKLKGSKEMADVRRFIQLEAVFSNHVGQHMRIMESMRRQQLMELAQAKGGKG